MHEKMCVCMYMYIHKFITKHNIPYTNICSYQQLYKQARINMYKTACINMYKTSYIKMHEQMTTHITMTTICINVYNTFCISM